MSSVARTGRTKKWSPQDWECVGYVDGKKTSIQLFSLARPHMQAFHLAWFAFFICFFTWFSIPAVMPTISKPKCLDPTSETCQSCLQKFADSELAMGLDTTCRICAPFAGEVNSGCGGLGLSKSEVRVSSLLSVAGTILIRIAIGPVADVWGIRISYSAILLFFSVPGFMAAAVSNYEELLAVRLLISFIGGSFVLTQLWTSRMFHSNVVGLANAISAGWGNMGGGAALAVLAQVFELFKSRGMTNEQSWRATLAWPPGLLLIVGLFIFTYGDDCPFGPHGEDTQRGQNKTSMSQSFARAARNWRSWILICLYACSFGSELVVSGNISLYFTEGFRMTQADAALAGSLMGLLNLVARPMGGMLSDAVNTRYGTRGRMWPLFLSSACMSTMMIAFVSIDPDPRNRQQVVICLGIWAFFSTMTSGTVFALVPFIDKQALGGVAGLVGAGGNVGALIGNVAMMGGYRMGFTVMAALAALSALLVPCLSIPGEGTMFKSEHSRISELESGGGIALNPMTVPVSTEADQATTDPQETVSTPAEAPAEPDTSDKKRRETREKTSLLQTV